MLYNPLPMGRAMILGLLVLCCSTSAAWAQIERNPESRTRPARARLAARAAEHAELHLPVPSPQVVFLAHSDAVARTLILACTETARTVALRFGAQTEEQQPAPAATAAPAPEAPEAVASSNYSEEQATVDQPAHAAPPTAAAGASGTADSSAEPAPPGDAAPARQPAPAASPADEPDAMAQDEKAAASPPASEAPGQEPAQPQPTLDEPAPRAEHEAEPAEVLEQEVSTTPAQPPAGSAEAEGSERLTVTTEVIEQTDEYRSLDDLAAAQGQRRDVPGTDDRTDAASAQASSPPTDTAGTDANDDRSATTSGREASLAGLLGWARALAAATAGEEPDAARRPDLSEHINTHTRDTATDGQAPPERPPTAPPHSTDTRTTLDQLPADPEAEPHVGALLESEPLTRSVVTAPMLETPRASIAGASSFTRPPLEPQLENWPPRMPEHSISPRIKSVARGHPSRKQVALTFDDGPHPQFTSQLLAVLDFYDVPATFFFVGLQSQKYPHWVKMTHQAGHEIGSQTYDHFRLPKLPTEEKVYQIDEYQRLIEGLIGVTPRFLRPPGGQLDRETEQLVAERGMVLALWDVGLNDTKDGKSAAQMLQTARKKIRPGSVVLAHDGIQATVDMLPELITMLRDQGYEFVTMSELAAGL